MAGVPAYPQTAASDARLSREKVDELRAFLTAHHRYPAGDALDDDERALATWVSHARSRGRAGQLSPATVAELYTLPGWTLDPTAGSNAALWTERYLALAAHVGRTGTAILDPTDSLAGFDVHRWVADMRYSHRAGRLSQTNTHLLEALKDWEWDPDTAVAKALIRHLADLAAHTTTADELDDAITASGFRVGRFTVPAWVAQQRETHSQGATPPWHDDLQTIATWSWRDKETRERSQMLAFLRTAELSGTLDVRELAVVRARLEATPPVPLATVAKTLGLSREGARQLEVRALAKATHPANLHNHRALAAVRATLGRALTGPEEAALLADSARALRVVSSGPIDRGVLQGLLAARPQLLADVIAHYPTVEYVDRVSELTCAREHFPALVSELHLRPATEGALRRAGIHTVCELTALTARELTSDVRWFGGGALQDVRDALAAIAPTLAGDQVHRSAAEPG